MRCSSITNGLRARLERRGGATRSSSPPCAAPPAVACIAACRGPRGPRSGSRIEGRCRAPCHRHLAIDDLVEGAVMRPAARPPARLVGDRHRRRGCVRVAGDVDVAFGAVGDRGDRAAGSPARRGRPIRARERYLERGQLISHDLLVGASPACSAGQHAPASPHGPSSALSVSLACRAQEELMSKRARQQRFGLGLQASVPADDAGPGGPAGSTVRFDLAACPAHEGPQPRRRPRAGGVPPRLSLVSGSRAGPGFDSGCTGSSSIRTIALACELAARSRTRGPARWRPRTSTSREPRHAQGPRSVIGALPERAGQGQARPSRGRRTPRSPRSSSSARDLGPPWNTAREHLEGLAVEAEDTEHHRSGLRRGRTGAEQHSIRGDAARRSALVDADLAEPVPLRRPRPSCPTAQPAYDPMFRHDARTPRTGRDRRLRFDPGAGSGHRRWRRCWRALSQRAGQRCPAR